MKGLSKVILSLAVPTALERPLERHHFLTAVRPIDTDSNPIRFEARLSQPSFLSTIVSYDGSLERVVIDDGDYRLTVHLPNGTDVRRVIEEIREMHPKTEVLARRRRSRSTTSSRWVTRTWRDDLTEKQRTTLETAYVSGFFEWPRARSGEEIASSLGISAPTFSQHIRAVERKLFDALFDELTDPDP